MFRIYMTMLVLSILLVSCNQDQNNQQGVQLENLRNTSSPNDNVENLSTAPTEQDGQSAENLNNNSTEDTPNLTEDSKDEIIIEHNEKDLDSSAQEAFPLSIRDFKERWNAISDEQTGDNYIQQFKRITGTNRYQAGLKGKLVVEIQTRDNNQINRIRIINTGTTNNDILKMLTSWWQVLLMTNPQTELHEIDTIFNKIGIGPNSNIEEIHEVSISFGGLSYQVTPSKESIIFEAIYPEITDTPKEGT